MLTISCVDTTISIHDIILRKHDSALKSVGGYMAKKTLELLTETMFYILMALNRQDMCGTDASEFVAGKTKGRIVLGPGTLYAILAKFAEEKLISEKSVIGRKRTYAITDKGKAAYREELSRLRACIADAESEDA